MKVTMEKYSNFHGDSGVLEYETGLDFIKIRFVNRNTIYVYNHSQPGSAHVEQMKRLATNGRGLATYISQNVKQNYSYKE